MPACPRANFTAAELKTLSTASPAEQLLTDFRQLSNGDQKQLLDELVLVYESRSRDPADDRELDMWSARVNAALSRALAGQDGEVVGLYAIKRVVGTRSNWQPVRDFVSRHCDGMSAIERGSVYALLADLLIQHCKQLAARLDSVVLGPKLVGQQCANIAGIFDGAFPGYLSAGLTKLVLTRQTKGAAD